MGSNGYRGFGNLVLYKIFMFRGVRKGGYWSMLVFVAADKILVWGLNIKESYTLWRWKIDFGDFRIDDPRGCMDLHRQDRPRNIIFKIIDVY